MAISRVLSASEYFFCAHSIAALRLRAFISFGFVFKTSFILVAANSYSPLAIASAML
jgi:hypothetical protein